MPCSAASDSAPSASSSSPVSSEVLDPPLACRPGDPDRGGAEGGASVEAPPCAPSAADPAGPGGGGSGGCGGRLQSAPKLSTAQRPQVARHWQPYVAHSPQRARHLHERPHQSSSSAGNETAHASTHGGCGGGGGDEGYGTLGGFGGGGDGLDGGGLGGGGQGDSGGGGDGGGGSRGCGDGGGRGGGGERVWHTWPEMRPGLRSRPASLDLHQHAPSSERKVK